MERITEKQSLYLAAATDCSETAEKDVLLEKKAPEINPVADSTQQDLELNSGAEKSTSKRLSRTMSTVSSFESTTAQVSGSFFKYIGYLFAVTFSAALTTLPLMLVPLDAPEEGMLANWKYYVFYNGFVGGLYAISSWNRLAGIVHRTEVAPSGGQPFKQVSVSLADPTVLMWLVVASLACCAGFVITTLPFQLFNTQLIATSYVMLYTCPITSGIADKLFVNLLPKEQQTEQIKEFCFNYSGTAGMPVVQVFLPVVVSSLLPNVSFLPEGLLQSIVPVFMFMYIGEFLHSWGKRHMTAELEKAELSGTYVDCGLTLKFEMMIATSQVLLYPGKTSWYILVGLFLLEAYKRVKELRAIKHELAGNSSYVPLGQDEEGVDATAIGFPWCGLSAEDQISVKNYATKVMTEEFAETIVAQAVVHLTTLTAPILSMLILIVIENYTNKPQYYLFDCLDHSEFLTAILYMGIAFLLEVVLFIVDLVFLACQGLAPVFLFLAHDYLHRNFAKVVLTLAFVSGVYTSCFFVKHDGLGLLNMLSNCK